MIVNKSMFPVQSGFSVISKMQDRFATLQMQLGTGVKAQTLADMGRDLPISLSVRSRLSTIAGYNANIDQVALRLSFYDSTLKRLDKIEGEARNSAVQGQYGTNNINMATISTLSKARLDELVTMLNADIGGRHLFGGNVTDKAPLPSTTELLDGAGGRAGYKTVVTERKMADAGADGRGRLKTTIDTTDPTSVVVNLAEDDAHPFGFKLSTYSTVGGNVTITPDFASDPADVSFAFAAPPGGIKANETITLGFTLPDGLETQITLRAVDAASATGAVGEFVIGTDPATGATDTATAFRAALNTALEQTAESELAAASTFAAAQNFFNGAGEPALRVAGNDPYTATKLKVATPADTVMWYSGQTADVSAAGMGRLTASRSGATVSLAQNAPVSDDHGFRITGATATVANAGSMTASAPAGSPPATSISFDSTHALAAGDMVTVTLAQPDGTERKVELTAVTGKAGPGQFTISTAADPVERQAQNAASFEKALLRSVTEAAASAEGNPRQSVSTSVEDAGRVNYGMQANENGYLRLIRSMAAMSVETYPEVANAKDPNSADLRPAKARFDAMARRQQSELSEGRNAERGSIEMITMEIGVAHASLGAAQARHTSYKAQLDNLLSDIEVVDKEQVAMEILALQTRLTASYQTTAMISQLSLVNFL